MSTAELKKRLIDKINKTENRLILKEVIRLLDIESEEIEVYKLNANQKAAIDLARAQMKEGKFLTEEQANKEIDEWLNK